MCFRRRSLSLCAVVVCCFLSVVDVVDAFVVFVLFAVCCLSSIVDVCCCWSLSLLVAVVCRRYLLCVAVVVVCCL